MSTVQATREFTATQMAAWLSANGFHGDNVVKVLFLGNSGSGKSFLCNALIGSDTFLHRGQATRVTSDNTFVAVVIGGTAYVVCNIPGLMEADPDNISRNKAAVEAAIGFLPGGLTVTIFVMSTTGGRVANQDFQAIEAVLNYVDVDLAATAVLINGVEWDEIENAGEYMADVTAQVQAIVDPSCRVEFAAQVPKSQKSNYSSAAMRTLNLELVTCLRSVKQASMTAKAGAELVLVLQTEVTELQLRIDQQKLEQEAYKVAQKREWEADVAAARVAHAAKEGAMRDTIEVLRNQPPQVIYVNGGDSSNLCIVS
jgi:hypothetical protein